MTTSTHNNNTIFVSFNPTQSLASASMNIFSNRDVNVRFVGAPATPYVQGGFMATLYKKCPELVDRYLACCKAGMVKVGDVIALSPIRRPDQVYLFCALHQDKSDCPTAQSLQACMDEAINLIQRWGDGFIPTGVASGKLGCGPNSKFISWGIAGWIMSFFLSKLNVPAYVYIGAHDKEPAYALKLQEEAERARKIEAEREVAESLAHEARMAAEPVVTVRTIPLPPVESAYATAMADMIALDQDLREQSLESDVWEEVLA